MKVGQVVRVQQRLIADIPWYFPREAVTGSAVGIVAAILNKGRAVKIEFSDRNGDKVFREVSTEKCEAV